MKRKKILLVEDEMIIAMSESNLLTKNGYEVLVATSGEKAIGKLHANTDISLILMDIDLGKGLDGTETAKKILEFRDIPIVFLTSHSEQEIVNKVRAITRYGYVLKGSNDFVLLSSIEMAYELFESHKKTKESEERFKNLFHKHNAIMLLINPESGAITDANLSAEKFYGYKLEELTTMKIDQINTLPIEQIQEERRKAEKEERNYFRFPHKLANGQIRIVEVHSSPISMKNETLLFSIIHDITDREKAKQALRESESLYRLLAENSNDVIWTRNWDTQTNTYISPSIFQLRGYTPEEVKTQKLEEIMSPLSLIKFKETINKLLDNLKDPNVLQHKSEYIELEQPCKNGSIVFTEITVRFTYDENKNLILVGNSRNITERKKAERKINLLFKEKELLLKEVHHRIKNNMSTIASLLSFQAQTIAEPQAVKVLNDARNRVKAMTDIYDNLYINSDYNNLRIKEYLDNLINELSFSYNIKRNITITKNIKNINLDIKTTFPLGIIITELITNALKYAFPNNQKGKIEINILEKGLSKVELNINDNGIGLKQDLIDTKTFGFGLNLVEIMVQQIDGKLTFENNNGTRVRIVFPLI